VGLKDEKYPILEWSGQQKGIIQPSKLFKNKDIPEVCIFSFFHELKEDLQKRGIIKKKGRFTTVPGQDRYFYKISSSKKNENVENIGLIFPGIGGPLAAMDLECAIARGCKRILVAGSAGAIEPDLDVGQIFLIQSALRDEGTSYHYLKPKRVIKAHKQFLERIKEILDLKSINYQLGTTWTTDGLFRETSEKIQKRKLEGAAIVEMEAASLMAVAKFRDIPLGHMIYCADNISGAEWDPRRDLDTPSSRRSFMDVVIEIGIQLSQS